MFTISTIRITIWEIVQKDIEGGLDDLTNCQCSCEEGSFIP